MVKIRFDAEMIAQSLVTGTHHPELRIVDGVPPGHVLVNAGLVNAPVMGVLLELTFVPLTEGYLEKAITVQTIRHEEKR